MDFRSNPQQFVPSYKDPISSQLTKDVNLAQNIEYIQQWRAPMNDASCIQLDETLLSLWKYGTFTSWYMSHHNKVRLSKQLLHQHWLVKRMKDRVDNVLCITEKIGHWVWMASAERQKSQVWPEETNVFQSNMVVSTKAAFLNNYT